MKQRFEGYRNSTFSLNANRSLMPQDNYLGKSLERISAISKYSMNKSHIKLRTVSKLLRCDKIL